MYDALIRSFEVQLAKRGYLVEPGSTFLPVRTLLYAKSPKLTSVGPIKYYDHFLFVDWDNDHFAILDALVDTYKKFSAHINKTYKIPRVWRMTLPNLAVFAISEHGFSPEVVTFVQNTYFKPWQGGETGQIMLIDLQNNKLIHHLPPTSRWDYCFPAQNAQREMQIIFNNYAVGKE